MSGDIPSWISAIADDRLRAEFAGVWQRLPDYVKPALEIDHPGVHLVARDKLETAARTRVWMTRQTGQTALMMFFRRDLLDPGGPPAVLRSLIVHELAHVYLRHFDNVVSKSHKTLAPEVLEYQEWHADFTARYLFGFDADYRERNEYLREHPELDEVRHAA